MNGDSGLAERALRAAARWSLTLGERFPYSSASVAFPARRAGGGDVVLKLQFPHRESEQEADALRLWAGNGAVRLLDAAPADHALLLERCVPGHPLSRAAIADPLAVIISLLPVLWIPADDPFTSLADEAAHWAGSLEGTWIAAGRPFERRLLDAALDAMRALTPDQGQQVLLNQDLHGGNVLAATRQPWLVIDPKPLVGEREFAVAPLVREAPPDQVLHRFDRLTAELGLDRERARGWSIAQTVAWGFDGGAAIPGHVETARRLLAGAGRRPQE